MRILHVREIANVAATLVDGLQRLGHQAELKPMRVRPSETTMAKRVLLLPGRLRETAEINRYIGRNHFDVVHLHWAYMGWMGIIGRYPYLLHCHGFDLTRNLRWPFVGWLTRQALRNAQRVFYSTPDLTPYATSVRKDAVFIPNPIHLLHFQPAKAPTRKGTRILMISRFEGKKGPETALAMIRELKRRDSSIQVDAFKWGVLASQLADPRLVNLIPTVPYRDMPALLSSYDIVVGQFKLGIVSMSELEAMACGRPVVSYFNYPEVYDEPPPIFSTRDIQEGAEILAQLAEDEPIRREAGERGRAWVEGHHDYVKVAELVEGHYQEVLEG